MRTLNEYIQEALDGSQMTYSGKNREFVDVILEDPEGKILILRRANYMKNFRACWGVIGGAVDVADKTPKDAAVRETAEETGISLSFNEVNNMKLLFDYKYKDGNVSHVFWTRLETKIDKVKISREHSKYEWIDFTNEKIDERKWIPEVFNILQKWEDTPINEKLVINKEYTRSYSYYPKTLKELSGIIKRRIKKLGPGTKEEPIDFNDIDVSNIISFFDPMKGSPFTGHDVEYIDVSEWNVSNAKRTGALFVNSKNLKSVGDLSRWDVSSVDNMGSMFYNCNELEYIGDISDWDVQNVKNFAFMFIDCRKLKNVGDLNKWEISKDVMTMEKMFKNTQINIPKWYNEKLIY